MQEQTPFIGKNCSTKQETNELYHYAVATSKRTAGCTENQGSWPWANWQHVYLVSKVEIPNVQ